ESAAKLSQYSAAMRNPSQRMEGTQGVCQQRDAMSDVSTMRPRGRPETGTQLVDAAMPIPERADRIREGAPSPQGEHPLTAFLNLRSHGLVEAIVELDQCADHRELLSHDQLGGARRCRCTQVRDEISDREVRLVPDGGDHGGPARDDGAGDA